MSEPVSVARQATFDTEPADSVTGNSIKRGNIELPVVDENTVLRRPDLSQHQCAVRSSLPSSGTSSPIYATREDYARFAARTRAALTKVPPSSYGDSSELEILSDVGLLDDSESDAPPPGSGLSLSAAKKLRKEPRLKVPSSKFDSRELTIQEETTQDVLASRTPPILSDTDTDNLPDPRRPQLQSQIIGADADEKSVVENPGREPVRGSLGDLTSVNLNDPAFSDVNANPANPPNSPQEEDVGDDDDDDDRSTPSTVVDGNDFSKQTDVDITSETEVVENSPEVVPQLQTPRSLKTDALESSFCESDWQPRIRKDVLRKNQEKEADSVSVEDKKVISNKYEHEVRPKVYARLDVGKRWAKGGQPSFHPEKNKAVPLNADDRTDGNAERLPVTNSSVSTGEFPTGPEVKAGETCVTASRTIPKPSTPQITDFLEVKSLQGLDAGAISDYCNEKSSGVPKRGAQEKSGSDVIKSTNAKDSPQRSENLNSSSMATSDGYDYESETFEEVLKDRNAMIKAERTYQKRIKQLEEELKGMINQCQALSDENKELRKKIDNLKHSESTPKDHSADTVDLASRIARLETEKENLAKTNEKLAAQLKEVDVKNKQGSTIYVENTKLKNKNAELERKIHSLDKQVESLSNRLIESDSEGAARVQSRNQDLELKLADLKRDNKTLTARVKSLENENKANFEELKHKKIELEEVLRAMQNETQTEVDLKQSHARLEKAQGEIHSVRGELEEMKRQMKEAGEHSEKMRSSLAKKDSDLKKMKGEHDSKDKLIAELRNGLEKSKIEIDKHAAKVETSKDLEKDTLALKSRIGSLKAEIESCIIENQHLKQDREEANSLIDRLKHENAATGDAIVDSRRYFRKWEIERDARNRAEVDLAKTEEELDMAEARLKESGNKINALHGRLKVLEDEKTQLRGGHSSQELEINNKILRDENKKLRQMLVERNIELTHKKSEKSAIDTKIQVLERRQQDAEVRVRQLSGWVGELEHNKPTDQKRADVPGPGNSNQRAGQNAVRNHFQSHKDHHPKMQGPEPQVAFVSPRARKPGMKRNAHKAMTPPPEWEDPKRGGRNADNHHTPMSLPLILDAKSLTPPDPHGGYTQLYKNKLKFMRDRNF